MYIFFIFFFPRDENSHGAKKKMKHDVTLLNVTILDKPMKYYSKICVCMYLSSSEISNKGYKKGPTVSMGCKRS